jgi:hypothetical protein
MGWSQLWNSEDYRREPPLPVFYLNFEESLNCFPLWLHHALAVHRLSPCPTLTSFCSFVFWLATVS